MQALANIQRFLDSLRHRLRVLLILRDSGLLLAATGLALLALVLAASALDYRTPLRALGLVLGLPLVLAYGVHLALSWRRLRDDTELARFVGQRFPRLHSDLLSTLQLGQEVSQALGEADPPQGSSPPTPLRFSATLWQGLATRTWRRMQRITISALVPAALLTPVAILLSTALVAWATAATTAQEQLQRGAARLLTNTAPSDGEVAPSVIIGDLALRLDYPAHMHRKPQTVQSSTGQITAPKGTRVQLSAASFVPLESPAALLVSWRDQEPGRQRLRLQLSGRRLGGSFIVASAGSYRFQVRTPDGRVVLDPLERSIHIEPDTAPRVTLYSPKNDLMVTERHHIELGATADDDHGIQRLDLVFQLGSAPPGRKTIWRPKAGPQPRTAVTKVDWDLAELDLTPGLRVAYWIEALDNDTVSGPKPGRSSVATFRVYSAEEEHKETLRQHEHLTDLALRVLSERLLLFAEEPATAAHLRLAKNIELNRTHASLVDGLRELRNRARKDRLVATALLRAISRMHQRMDEAVRAEAARLRVVEAATRRNPRRAIAVGPLKEANARLVDLTERQALRLANMLDEQRLQSMMTLSRRLREGRKRLADLLKRYRKNRSPELRKQLLRQIERMQRQVAALMARMNTLGSQLPDEYLNAEAMKGLDLRQQLQQLAQQIRSGTSQQVEAALSSLQQKLDQLDQLLAGNLQQYRSGRMGARERAINETLDRLRGLESEQRAIARRTKRVIRRYHQRAAHLLKHRINPFVQKQLGKLKRLQKRVSEIEAGILPPYDQEQLERIRQRIRDLKGMLDQADLDEALRMAMRTRNGLQVLQDDLTEELEGQPRRRRARLKKNQRRTYRARLLAEELAADLRSIFPNPRTLLDKQDRAQMASLLRKQRTLRRALQRLKAKLEARQPQPGKGARGTELFNAEMSAAIKESGALMRKSSGKLGNLQPQEAHGAQEAAAERLAQLRRQVQQMRQPRSWGKSGATARRERIRIPGADAFRPPKAFRQDILDAMKEKAPQRYRGQVKRYYEELVR